MKRLDIRTIFGGGLLLFWMLVLAFSQLIAARLRLLHANEAAHGFDLAWAASCPYVDVRYSCLMRMQ